MLSGKSIKNLRILHRYLGLFFSPAILFFAFSGGLQVFNLHKQDKSIGYIPPAWILLGSAGFCAIAATETETSKTVQRNFARPIIAILGRPPSFDRSRICNRLP